MKQLGYTGSLTRVYEYVRFLRQQSGPQYSLKSGAGKFSPRQVVGMLLTPDRSPEEQTLLDRLAPKCPDVERARALAESFAALIRKHPREDARIPLDLWLKAAVASSLMSSVSFARGLKADREAVVKGLSPDWSNGATSRARSIG